MRQEQKSIFTKLYAFQQMIAKRDLPPCRKICISNEITENFLRSLPLWVASAVAGGIVVLYAALFARAEYAGSLLIHENPWFVILFSPTCFVIAAFLVHRFAPLARGSGIPQIRAALEISGRGSQSGVERLLGLRVIIVKILSSCLIVFGGGAIGREHRRNNFEYGTRTSRPG